MTCTPTSSPTRRAAAAPASVAALTDPTSPRTMAVTSPASTFCQPTKTTLAVFTIASAASIMPTRPRVSTSPSASPISRLSAIDSGVRGLRSPHRLYIPLAVRPARSLRWSGDSPARRHGKRVDDPIAIDEPYLVDHVGDHTRVIRKHPHPVARLERCAALDANRCVFFRQALDGQH